MSRRRPRAKVGAAAVDTRYVWLDITCDACLTLDGVDRRVGIAHRPLDRPADDAEDELRCSDGLRECRDGVLLAVCTRCRRQGRPSRWLLDRDRVTGELDRMERAALDGRDRPGDRKRRVRLTELGGVLEPSD